MTKKRSRSRLLKTFLVWLLFWGIFGVFLAPSLNITQDIIMLVNVMGLTIALSVIEDVGGYTRGYNAGFNDGAEAYREAAVKVIDGILSENK